MPRRVEQRPRWYLLYYILAALDVVTVLASLTLNQLVMETYVDSVATSARWEEREREYARLFDLARAVNAPGNDVFDSHDVDTESARLRTALRAFNAQFDAARAEAARNASPEEAALLLPAFDEIQRTMDEMLGEADLIFHYFAIGQDDRAGRRMATMDRKYGTFHQALARLNGAVRDIRNSRLEEQLAAARVLKRLEYLIVGLAILMIAGALCYGARIYRAMRAADAERAEQMAALRCARAEADAAARAKSTFLATMSHEIRTPLNTVLLTLDLLAQPGSENEKQSYLAMARSCGGSLKRLIDNVLDVSKIDAGKIELEHLPFDVRRTMDDLVAPYLRRAEAKGLSLALRIAPEVPLLLQGDPVRFGQIVTNLVDNAVKFTHDGSVEVSVSSHAERLRVAVRDTGIGLSPEQQKRIFEDFVQADESMTRKYGGTGLGLGIARRLVALMQGELGVSATPGGGTTFWFDVHFAASSSAVPASPLDTPRSAWEEILPGRRVLVVEDAPESRALVAAILRQLGISVDLAADGSDAVSAAAATRYDAILMDIAMPVMDGLEATRRIRQRERGGEEVPIIALTGRVMDGVFEQCLDAGIDDLLAKPVTRDGVITALQRWIEPAAA